MGILVVEGSKDGYLGVVALGLGWQCLVGGSMAYR